MIEAADILMCVGAEHYETPQHFIVEAQNMGVSKRLPLKAPPQGLVPGLSRVFFRHERACAVFDTAPADDPVAQAKAREMFWRELRELRDEVVERSIATWQQSLPDRLWHRESWMYLMANWHRAAVDVIFAKYQVRFAPGIFGYCVFGGFAMVTNKRAGEEVEVPECLRDLPELRAIRVKKVREGSDDER